MTTLYSIIVQPIEYLISVIFTVMYRFFGHPGYAIIGVSLTVSLLTLPLYRRADAVQAAQRKKERSMQRWIDHINHTFHGDERHMMLTTHYRENHYHPYDSLKGAIPLLLQIPFFAAAYHYLSHLALLEDCSFAFLRDLGTEDATFHIGTFPINVLPILMTLINFCSTYIYTKGFSFREKAQPYLLALIFLALLYHSPSGLVFYWTLNNVFSLLKNVIQHYSKDSKRLLHTLFAAMGVAFLLYALARGKIAAYIHARDYESLLLVALVFLLMELGALHRLLPLSRVVPGFVIKRNPSTGGLASFLLSGLVLTLLIGVMIPLTVVSSSPLEFVDLFHYVSPLDYVKSTACAAAGLILLWGTLIYLLADEQTRQKVDAIFFCLAVLALLNDMTLTPDVGSYSTYLTFDRPLHYSILQKGVNLAILLLAGIIAIYIRQRFTRMSSILLALLAAASLIFCGIRLSDTLRELSTIDIDEDYAEEDVSIPLSRNGHNVIVIMLDRAIGAYIPFIMDELPEVREQYAGFTFYPNTTSLGLYTNSGSPSLFGGYDYTPAALNARSEESLAQKQNEALLTMPILFGEAGYQVSVCDLPNTNYSAFFDTSLFAPYPYVNAYHLDGRQSDGLTAQERAEVVRHNFFFHSIYKCMPALLQGKIYDGGAYLSTRSDYHTQYTAVAVDNYTALQHLSDITKVIETGDTLFLYDNNLTHTPSILALPDYTLGDLEANADYDIYAPKTLDGITMTAGTGEEDGMAHYHVNAAAIRLLGAWFDTLRSEGVYDNTRIILVADHGRALGQFADLLLEDGEDAQGVNALLMIKDFDATEYTVDGRLMTNADTVALATTGLLDRPSHPFTGSIISIENAEAAKSAGVDVFWSKDHSLSSGNVLEPVDAPWYHIDDDIFMRDHWRRVN